MDDTNAPFTTLGYPQKANLEEADTVLSFHAEMDQREMPMPLPSNHFLQVVLLGEIR